MKLKNRIYIIFTVIDVVPAVLAGVVLAALLGGREPTRAMLLNVILIMLCVIGITAAVLSALFSKSVAAPLARLTDAARSISDGNLDFVIPDESTIYEISELCIAFDRMRRSLIEANEEKIRFDEQNRELISNISHDLKTPITAVKGYVEGIMDGVADTPEKMDRYIRTIYNKTNEMDRLINELSFYSKITTNRIPYAFSEVNVRNFLDGAAESIGEDLRANGFQFVYRNTVPAETAVIADEEQLTRVLNNLVGNAVKYSDKPEKRVGISAELKGDEVRFCVSDNGKGISGRDISNIFNRFYRGDSSRGSSEGGSGIGLSIVKKIIEDHSGRVWVSSREGEGTEMWFALRRYSNG